MEMNVIELPSAHSTNSVLAGMAAESPHGTVVSAFEQTAGRGQRGNSWEAAPGKNITMSILLRPEYIRPSGQFVISQAVSVAIVDFLRRYLPDEAVAVKWPNDIYVGDRKICGILIENTLAGSRLEYSIVGIGLNVNQTHFLSDAPNPCSIANFTGLKYPVDALVKELATVILARVAEVDTELPDTAVAEEYRSRLWRSNGFYPYHDNLLDEVIEASIHYVAPTGHITLATRSGDLRTYAFKEISAVI
ncbi:MAG: biotin--[acetyl-CoA-carboxylase] ligase [Duncaniella sp.]|nr:biotin--[acetyl-CoA-carboxylase] ligase [Duncaniella sp.]